MAARADGQKHPGRGRGQAAADRAASHPIVGGREAGERVQAAPGRPQRPDPRAGTDARHGHQEQFRPARASRQVLHAPAHRTDCPTTSARSRDWKARPPVMGEVKRIDPTNRRARADDRLRRRPRRGPRACTSFASALAPNTSAKSRSSRSIPTRPSPRWSATPIQGKKIKEGDIVSSTIKPRF